MAGTSATGRRRKPTIIKRIEGNPGQRKLPKDEPVYSSDIPPPPGGLSFVARNHWTRLAELLGGARVLTQGDLDALAMLCDAIARWQEATQKANTEGMVVNGGPYPRVNPVLRVADEAFKQAIRLLNEFGMTPAARSKVTVTSGETSDKDPAADYFG